MSFVVINGQANTVSLCSSRNEDSASPPPESSTIQVKTTRSFRKGLREKLRNGPSASSNPSISPPNSSPNTPIRAIHSTPITDCIERMDVASQAQMGIQPPQRRSGSVVPEAVLLQKSRERENQKKEKRDKAARCIQRAWRRSNAGIDLLRKGKDAISDLPHDKFKTFFTKCKPILERGAQNPVRKKVVQKTVSDVLQHRQEQQVQLSMPICSIRAAGSLPKYELATESATASLRRFGGVFVTNETLQEYQSIPKSPPATKEELDVLVRGLSEERNLIPWDYTQDGCYARAQLVIDFLALSGVPPQSMAKQYVLLPIGYGADVRGIDGTTSTWFYHVAPIVQLADGSKWIIDPALAPDRALSVEEWINLQKKDPDARTPMKDMDIVQLNPYSRRKKIDYNQNIHCLMFKTNIATSIARVDTDQNFIELTQTYDSERDSGLRRLAEYRGEIERSWVERLTQPTAAPVA